MTLCWNILAHGKTSGLGGPEVITWRLQDDQQVKLGVHYRMQGVIQTFEMRPRPVTVDLSDTVVGSPSVNYTYLNPL